MPPRRCRITWLMLARFRSQARASILSRVPPGAAHQVNKVRTLKVGAVPPGASAVPRSLVPRCSPEIATCPREVVKRVAHRLAARAASWRGQPSVLAVPPLRRSLRVRPRAAAAVALQSRVAIRVAIPRCNPALHLQSRCDTRCVATSVALRGCVAVSVRYLPCTVYLAQYVK